MMWELNKDSFRGGGGEDLNKASIQSIPFRHKYRR